MRRLLSTRFSSRLAPKLAKGSRQPPIELVKLSAASLLPLAERLLPVYYAAFAAPPYNRDAGQVRAFAGTLSQHMLRRDFRSCIALEPQTGKLTGFTYGYSGGAGEWWHDIVAAAMAPAARDAWLAGSFEFAELAVLPEAQGRGIGGRLHDALLDGLANRTAVLSTIQQETSALQLYRKRGWVDLVHDLAFPDVAERYLLMGIDLRERRTRAAR